MSALWHWFIIGLLAAGVGTVVIGFVILLYVIAFYCHTKGFFADKLTSTRQIIGELTGYALTSLGL